MRRISLLACCVLVLCGLWVSVKKPSRTLPTVKRPAAVKVRSKPMVASQVDALRSPARNDKKIDTIQSKPRFRKERRPTLAPAHRPSDSPGIVVGKNLRVLPDTFAVPETRFRRALGPRFGRAFGMAIFRHPGGTPPPEGAPVVFDEANQTFHPVASVLKFNDVSALERERLLRQGLQEHYYHVGSRTLFLTSDATRVIDHYVQFTQEGLDVELEIIRGVNLPR